MSYNKFKKNKFGNVGQTIDGVHFPSKLEARFYKYLIANNYRIELQPSFELQPKFRHQGKGIRSIVYKADFKVFLAHTTLIIDAKGFETPEFKIKAKMLKFHYPDADFHSISTIKNLKLLLCQRNCNSTGTT